MSNELTMIVEKFSQRLKELRLEHGMTQQQLAKQLSIQQQSYARYEKGTGEPSLQTLIKMTAIFAVTADYLLGIADE